MKRIISLIIVFSMVLSATCTAFADNVDTGKIKVVESASFSNEVISKLSKIPIFMTYINDNNVSDLDQIKESISAELKNANKTDLVGNNRKEELKIVKNAYTINEITNSAKLDIINNPLYSSTLLRAQELIEQGVTVSNINFFVNGPNGMVSINNTNDPSYWEENNTLFGIYSGYKFYYYESSMDLGTDEVTPGNISPSLKWDEIVKKSVETFLDHYVKDVFYTQVRTTLNTLSSFYNLFTAPISVAYGPSGGHLKARVQGDLYMRTIYIEDKLDRIPGYAYYQWGTVEQYKASVIINSKWPISLRPGGTTYNYANEAKALGMQTTSTVGFYGSQSILSSMLNLYKNTNGYFQHNERIDHMSIIANLLN